MPSGRFALLCFLVLALPAQAGDGRQASPVTPLRLTIRDDEVRVDDGNGNPMQRLPRRGDNPTEDSRETSAFVADMNFDGFPDVGVLRGQGIYNAFYDCWLWLPDAGRFELREEMGNLPNPRFVPGSKRVLSCLHGCDIPHLRSEYAWENGRLTQVARVTREFSENGKDTLVRQYERGSGGEMRLISELSLAEALEPPGAHAGSWIADTLNFFPADLPPRTVMTLGETRRDGGWRTRHMIADGSALLDSERLPRREYGEATLTKMLADRWPGAHGIALGEFDALAEKLSYPVLKADLASGGNEDARNIAAILIFTDDWTFFFALDASADAGPLWENAAVAADAGAQSAALRADMERVLLSVTDGIPAGDHNLFRFPASPTPRLAPSCGDDSLSLRFRNLTKSRLEAVSLCWKRLEGGGRFALAEAAAEPGGEYAYTAREAVELDSIRLYFSDMEFVFDSLARVARRQKMALDISLDANDIPRLTLLENRDARDLDPKNHFNEWIDVKGTLAR